MQIADHVVYYCSRITVLFAQYAHIGRFFVVALVQLGQVFEPNERLVLRSINSLLYLGHWLHFML